MKSTPELRLSTPVALGCLLLVAAASAAAQEGSYGYGGLSVGQAHAKIDQPRITARLLDAGLTTTAMTLDEKSVSYKVFGGYQFNRYLALEGGYFNLGKFGFTSTTQPAGTLDGQIKLQGVNVDVIGSLPLGRSLAVFGRVGAQYAQARDRFSSTGAVTVGNASPKRNEVNPKVGLGLQWALSPSFTLRGEVERYRVNDAVGNHGGINVYSLSLVFPFGGPRVQAAAPAPRMAAAPVYVAPAPAPAPVSAPAPPPAIVPPTPVVVAVPAAPAPRRVSFSADSLFTFDKSVVRPEGQADLDRFARELQGVQFGTISVQGHTDRLGSAEYNQRLSERRADAVKSYLVSAGGLAAEKITAAGRGESDPVTRPDDCKGNTPTPTLIACLQPDRRVVVEVTGTR